MQPRIDVIQDTLACYLSLVGMVTRAAGECVIKADGLAIGPHPYEDLRDEGELAVLDLDRDGSPILAHLDDAAPLIIERCGQVRTLGAILVAVEDGALEPLSGLAVSSIWIADHTPGGPADRLLRIGLAARQVALGMMGELGERGDKLAARRGTGVLAGDGRDFDDYSAIAFLGLTAGDKRHLEPAAVAA